jgi:hypothetical protein
LNLEEKNVSINLKAPEVVLFVRVVLGGKIVERPHSHERFADKFWRESRYFLTDIQSVPGTSYS